jgi:hypothetical protein
MIAPLAPTLPPLGAGAHCDASALPKLEIFRQWRAGNTALSQSGGATAAGACLHAPKSVRIIQRISSDPIFHFFLISSGENQIFLKLLFMREICCHTAIIH